MIHIQRVPEPSSLRRTVVSNARRSLSGRIATDRSSYMAQGGAKPSKTLEFHSRYYGHADVRRALEVMQRGKCAFCESKIKHIASGDVEHFRPKGGYRQGAGSPLVQPGYYWLAYDWENLLLSCPECNQREKGNLFPLATPSTRVTSHKGDVGDEDPLFIDPSKDEPSEHIGWRRWTPYHRTNRGRETIESLGLKRPKLRERREERYKIFKRMFEDLALLNRHPGVLGAEVSRGIDEHLHRLSMMLDEHTEYAAMTRAAVGARFQLI